MLPTKGALVRTYGPQHGPKIKQRSKEEQKISKCKSAKTHFLPVVAWFQDDYAEVRYGRPLKINNKRRQRRS